MKCPALLRSRFLFCCVIFISACTTSGVTPIGEWRDPAYAGKINNILIVGATSRSTRRRVFEDMFVEALASASVKSVTSYSLVINSLKLSRDTVRQAIQDQDIDAVLVMRLLGVKESEQYKLPSNYDHHDDYVEYFDLAVSQSNRGYYATFKALTLETNVYDAASGALIWSMQSDTIEQSAPRHLLEEQIKLTVDMLSKQGLL